MPPWTTQTPSRSTSATSISVRGSEERRRAAVGRNYRPESWRRRGSTKYPSKARDMVVKGEIRMRSGRRVETTRLVSASGPGREARE